MAKDKNAKSQIEAQRRAAQKALDENSVPTGRGKHRQLTRKERALYQRVVRRADKLLGPAPKPRESGIEGLRSGLQTLKSFAARLRAGREKLEEVKEGPGAR
jgi:hypothetical protein